VSRARAGPPPPHSTHANSALRAWAGPSGHKTITQRIGVTPATPIGAIIAAVYAIKAFGKQSEINAEQTRVLELQATELRESN